MCSPGKKIKTHRQHEWLQIRQKANVHNPLSDTGVLILEGDVCVCVEMRVWTVKVHWTALPLLTLTGREL